MKKLIAVIFGILIWNCPKTVLGVGPCSPGVGSVVMDFPIIRAGEISVSTLSFTTDVSGIPAGSTIAFRVPDFWEPPDNFTSPGVPGFVELDTSGVVSGAILQLSVNGQMIRVLVSNQGPNLASGDTVDVIYTGWTCSDQANGTFRAFADTAQCGLLENLGVDQVVPVIQGSAIDVGTNYPFHIVELNTVSRINLFVRDSCGRMVSPGSPVNVDLQVARWSVDQFITDSVSSISLFQNFSNPGVTKSVVIDSVNPSATIYYRITSSQFKPDNYLEFSWDDIQSPGNQIYNYTNMIPISAGITNASVDTGTIGTLQTVSFSPDEDGTNDEVYINFQLGSTEAEWEVTLTHRSSGLIPRRFFGFGSPARLAWDGRQDFQEGIAPAGIYDVQIKLTGGTIINSSLSFTLVSPRIYGTVVDPAQGNAPVHDANVIVFGNNIYRNVKTLSDGTFSIYGIPQGILNFKVEKFGFSPFQQNNINMGSSDLNMGTISLEKGAVLRVNAIRPNTPPLPEIFGWINAFSQQGGEANGNLHFKVNSTTSDAGDFWNVNLTTYTDLLVRPNIPYQVRVEIPSHGAAPISDQTLGVGEIRQLTIPLTRRANIGGTVNLPFAVTEPNGVGISAEVGRDVNLDGEFDSYQNGQVFWGHGQIDNGQTSGTYQVFGIPNGTYLVRVRVPGYVVSSTYTTITNNIDVTNLDFNNMSRGGNLVVSVIVNGDTTKLSGGNFCGPNNFRVGVGAHSSNNGIGSWQEMCLSSNTVSTTGAVTLTGLLDGLYDVFVDLPGFEVVPPGPKFASVSGGSGSINLNYNQFKGKLTGTITLPGTQSDYSNVILSLSNFHHYNGEPPTPEISGASYTFRNLGTGFYHLRAFYPQTGFLFERGVQILNSNTPTILNLDLSGNTFSISGTVNSNAGPPYSSLSYIVNQSTPTAFKNLNGSLVYIPANRIMAARIGGEEGGGPPPNSPGDPNSISTPTLDTTQMFYATYSAQGNFQFINIPPGSYKVFNNGEMDGNRTNGKEIAQTSRVVHVVNANVTGINFSLSDGFNISGTLRIGNAVSEPGRNIEVALRNLRGEEVTRRNVYLTGTQANFTLEKVTPGKYVLYMEDFDYPRKYSAKEVSVEVGASHVTGKEIVLLETSRIQGTLRIATSGEIITQNNFQQLLPNNFQIFAQANPWFPGGHGSADHPPINSSNKFSIAVNPGVYDLFFKSSDFIGDQAIAQGQRQFVPIRISGIEVTAGQTLNLDSIMGPINLREGIRITGTVTTLNGTPIPNIEVEAEPSGNLDEEGVSGFTNDQGQYVIHGIDPQKRFYDIFAAPRLDPHDERFGLGNGQTKYGEVIKRQFDVQKILTGQITSVNFQLQVASGSISGTVQTQDGGEMVIPFGEGGGNQLGAFIILSKRGEVPEDNPLGNYEGVAGPDGNFLIDGLLPGVYELWALVQGYRAGYVPNITVGNQNTNVGVVVASTGFKLSGTIKKPDGSLLNTREFDVLLAVRNGFQDLIIGDFEEDSNGTISGYTLSGFETNQGYTVILMGNNGESILLASNLILTSDTELSFTIQERVPEIFLRASAQSVSGPISLQFEFTKPLRNSTVDLDNNGLADDSEGPKLVFISTGNGSLTYGEPFISGDRFRISSVTYTPAAGETSFVVTASATFVSKDSITGLNHRRTKSFTVFLGLGQSRSKRVNNAAGGRILLDDDPSEFGVQPGTFGNDANLEVEVTLNVASGAENLGNNPGGSRLGVMNTFKALGPRAYPLGISQALLRAQALEVDPFSSFYEIFLPAGVNHHFPSGKEASLCLKYDDTVSDSEAYSLNIYFFNDSTNEFVIENQNKAVDTENKRICVSLSHASVFTILASSQSVITGGAYSGDLQVLNFPNPFDLKNKTVTLQNPGSNSSSQNIEGTMIKFSVPSSMSGDVEIEIFDILGTKVRTLTTTVASGGTHNYLEWDGKNDSGKKVASGAYIGRFTIGGGNERFIKMAVVK